MKWYLIEVRRGDMWETPLKAESRSDALAESRLAWERLSAHDQKDTEEFYAVYANDGVVDLDSATDAITHYEILSGQS